jgi:hypothetical protein
MIDYLKPWHVVDINIADAVRSDFDFDHILKERNQIKYCHGHNWRFASSNADGQLTDFFNQSWLDYMKDIGFEICDLQVFYREANFVWHRAHIDMTYNPESRLGLALNWCQEPDDGEMAWYNLPDSTVNDNETKRTEANTRFYDWDIRNLTEVARRVIGPRCTVVQVDIPHNIIMYEHPRWAISARTTERFATWQDIVNKIQTRIIE